MWRIQEIAEEYRTRMSTLLDLYSSKKYDPKYPLICMDEKSKQLPEDSRQPIKARPETLRNMTMNISEKVLVICNIFFAVAPKEGIRVTENNGYQDKVRICLLCGKPR